LDDKIDDVALQIYTNNASLQSQITTVSNSLTNSISGSGNTLSQTVSDINSSITSNMSDNGLYITTWIKPITADGWYREYFSDSSKSNRVWIEQGGFYHSDAVTNKNNINNYVLTFHKPFLNEDYFFTRTLQIQKDAGSLSTRWIMFNDKTHSNITIDVVSYAYSHQFMWYACGR
jgi:hypothetical protein